MAKKRNKAALVVLGLGGLTLGAIAMKTSMRPSGKHVGLRAALLTISLSTLTGAAVTHFSAPKRLR